MASRPSDPTARFVARGRDFVGEDCESSSVSEQWRAVARVGEVRAGDVIAIDLDGLELALGRDGDRYFAVQRRCAHLGGDLADGIVARGHVVCPQHGWRFSTATGRHDGDERFCLVTYAVRVVGDQIEIDPQPRRSERSEP
jgi:3-phenylpropionate/trans-cinnamate dioxygenase ferredoxin component